MCTGGGTEGSTIKPGGGLRKVGAGGIEEGAGKGGGGMEMPV